MTKARIYYPKFGVKGAPRCRYCGRVWGRPYEISPCTEICKMGLIDGAGQDFTQEGEQQWPNKTTHKQ